MTTPTTPPASEGQMPSNFSAFDIPDGVVIGMPWPHTLVTWPGGKFRGATKVEHDLWRIAATLAADNKRLRKALATLLATQKEYDTAEAEWVNAQSDLRRDNPKRHEARERYDAAFTALHKAENAARALSAPETEGRG